MQKPPCTDHEFARRLVDYYETTLCDGQRGYVRHAMPGFMALINRARELHGMKPLDEWGQEINTEEAA